MSHLINWLRSLGDQSHTPKSSTSAAANMRQGISRADAIATLRSEIARLQSELIVLSQAEERGQTATSTAKTERRLLDAQRELATYQARV
jgi:hypothetical protein